MTAQTRSGEVYWLDFDRLNFEEPEMIKKRMVAVLTSRSMDKRRNLVTIVPLSATPPREVSRHVVPLSKEYSWIKQVDDQALQLWAKCDMIYTVAIHRLQPVRKKKAENRLGIGGNRAMPTPRLSAEDMQNIRLGVAHALTLDELIVEEARKAYLRRHQSLFRKLLPKLFQRKQEA